MVEPEVYVRQQCIRTQPVRYGRDEVYSAHEENYLEHCAYVTGSECDPVSMREAQESVDSEKWMEAARDEYQLLIDHETLELGPLPEGRSVVGSRWVFKRKLDDKGNVSWYKADWSLKVSHRDRVKIIMKHLPQLHVLALFVPS